MVSILTLISRFFGLARDAAIAYFLGTRAGADAFYVAFRIPNLLRRLLAEGNLTLSFVPVFTKTLHEDPDKAKKVVDATFTFLLLLLITITLAGVFGASYFVRATALGFTQDAEKFQLTVQLTRITFPYILLVSLSALMMGILNGRKHFAAPAFAPVLLNVGIITGAFLFSRFLPHPEQAIAWGVLLGGFLQLAIQVPFVIRQGFFPRLSFNYKMPEVRKVGRLMLPALWGSAVYQFNLLAITFMASYLPTGSISYLWYADRVIEFPLGVFAISIATVALPSLSDHVAQENPEAFKKTMRQALGLVFLINIPAALGLAVLAEPILALLFYRGDFDQASTQACAQALRFFAIGLPFVSATRITASAFYAMQEAKKPVRAANLAVLVNLIVAGALLFPLQHRGLALSVSMGSLANFIFLMIAYRRKIGKIGWGEMRSDLWKIILSSLIMSGALLAVLYNIDYTYAEFSLRLMFVLGLVAFGAILYGGLVLLLRVKTSAFILKKISKRSIFS